jgi:imidazolonepropionase-like amidohydrolase
MYANTVAEAKRTLLRGFTTVRDMAGPTFGIKEAIEAGPRVYPRGALISATGGHGDFSAAFGVPQILGGDLSHLEAIGEFSVATGVPQVSRRRVLFGWRLFTDAPFRTLRTKGPAP